MREEVIRIVEVYINALRSHDVDAVPLHTDVEFESPIRKIKGVANFRKGMAEFFPILKGIEVVRLTADDDTCAVMLEVQTIFGIIPFAEFLQVVDGQIASVRAYFDPRPVLEGMSKIFPS